jgi:hypothetical protein
LGNPLAPAGVAPPIFTRHRRAPPAPAPPRAAAWANFLHPLASPAPRRPPAWPAFVSIDLPRSTSRVVVRSQRWMGWGPGGGVRLGWLGWVMRERTRAGHRAK